MLGWAISAYICSALSFFYPMYMSLKAICSEQKDDDTTWLVYWVILGLWSFLETCFWFVVPVLPFYFEVKTIIVFVLIFPHVSSEGPGANWVYRNLLKPQFDNHDNDVDKMLGSALYKVKSSKIGELAGSVATKIQNQRTPKQE
eukprot:c25240_g1_i1.p1 GENE.c25240_g1_i1~~c25240_g1_i1.p1  ORF type:complete len:144 (-),score=34.12 c25240_g1_i1:45-476(-)